MWHFVPEEVTKERKHAEVIADHLVNWLKERGVEERVTAPMSILELKVEPCITLRLRWVRDLCG